MYSADHPAVARSMQQSWELLTPLLKSGPKFTFGFMQHRVLLNTRLVAAPNLAYLDAQFSKREIGTVCFQAGVTLNDFKGALALLTARPAVIAERGGIKSFLAANPLAGIRITPAAKPKEEDGDSIDVGMDLESYLTAQAILEPEHHLSTVALDMLLQAGGKKYSAEFAEDPREVLEVADRATRATLANPGGNLSELLIAMTQMLAGLKPDDLLAGVSPEKQKDLLGHPPGIMAVHLMEDAMAGWAAERLAASATSEASGGWDQEVLQALLRGLKATHVAERLLQKLAQFVEQANLPKEVFERIRREVMWFTLAAGQKHVQFLRLERYTPEDFARLLQYLKEAMNEGRVDEASAVAEHYFRVLEKAPAVARAEELQRAPELLSILSSAQTLPLMHTLAEPLVRELLEEASQHGPCHVEAANCLATLAQNAGRFEDFEFVQKVGADLKRSLARDPARHRDCCGKALSGLLTAEALERLIESFLEKRSDAAWVRRVTSLLMMVGAPGAEVALHRLDEESAASNRLPLIRLIRGLGATAIEPTSQRLADERWYVVRNAASILGDLGAQDLPARLRGALRHADLRVQRAAVTTILQSHTTGRGGVLAEALPHLHAGLLEMVLDELTVLKDPVAVEHLESLVFGKGNFMVGVREKAVVALAAISTDPAAEVLAKIVADTGQPLALRRAALEGLYHHTSTVAPRLVERVRSLDLSLPAWPNSRRPPDSGSRVDWTHSPD